MATKLSMAVQLERAEARIRELEVDCNELAAKLLTQEEKLKKELESSKQQYKWADERADRAKGELEQVHAFFDSLPGALPRAVTAADGYSKTEHSLMTRFSVWLATRRFE